jgi:hypothetical protein
MDKEERKEEHQINAWTNTSVVQKVEPGQLAAETTRSDWRLEFPPQQFVIPSRYSHLGSTS